MYIYILIFILTIVVVGCSERSTTCPHSGDAHTRANIRSASKSAWLGGVNDFRDQLSDIVGHLHQLYRLVDHLDRLHKYQEIKIISQ